MDILIILLALLGLGYMVMFGAAGAKSVAGTLFSGEKLPEGVENVKLDKTLYHWGLIFVKYAWHFRDYGTYTAKVECQYTGESEVLRATSKEDLERQIEETVSSMSRHIDIRKGKS